MPVQGTQNSYMKLPLLLLLLLHQLQPCLQGTNPHSKIPACLAKHKTKALNWTLQYSTAFPNPDPDGRMPVAKTVKEIRMLRRWKYENGTGMFCMLLQMASEVGDPLGTRAEMS